MTLDLLVAGGRVAVGGTLDLEEPASIAIGIADGKIAFVGPETESPVARERWDAGGRLITPGLVDCHTHLLFGGDRLADFRRRVEGRRYEDIAAEGGGIRSTVAATRAASDDDLVAGAVRRLRWLRSSGVTTVEVKSGYGLSVDQELRMLRLARRAAADAGVAITTTLLGAHVVPDDMDRAHYVELVCTEMIPAAVGLADAVDVFVDSIAFTAAEAAAIFASAKTHGFAVKAHVGQLDDIGGAEVAAEYGAISVDHCEQVPPAALAALAAAGTTAVLVPGASLFLGETQVPPVDGFRSHGVPMAVTTDLNPGSSPLASLPLAAALAVHRFGLTPAEAIAGITHLAARALGLDDRGVVAVGARADLAVWDVDQPIELTYWLGAPICRATVVGGVVEVTKPGVGP